MSGEEVSLSKTFKVFNTLEDFISVQFPDADPRPVIAFTSYSFHTDFMTPNSSFSFEIADERYFKLLKKVQNGQRMVLNINETIQFVGYVDQINVSSGPSGTIMQIRGRDVLGPVCDATMDPKFNFSENDSPKKIVEKLIKPFGLSLQVMGYDNTNKLTGQTVQYNTKDKGRTSIQANITNSMDSKLRPHKVEGIYAFMERLGRRFGYHIWAHSDGTKAIMGTPTYHQEELYKLTHKTSQNNNKSNNVISSQMSIDWTGQPSAIVCLGNDNGKGQWRKGSIKTIMLNELLVQPATLTALSEIYTAVKSKEPKPGSSSDGKTVNKELLKLFKDWTEAKFIPSRPYINVPDFILPPNKFVKVLFLHDDESKTHKQLESYTRRLMSEYQVKFMSVQYTVNGHSQSNVFGLDAISGGKPNAPQVRKAIWAVDTLVKVDDDVNNIHQNLWIKGRTFTKDASGTKTTIECIFPHLYQLTEQDL